MTSVSSCHFREGLDGGITKYRVFEVHWNIPDFLARLNNLKSGVRCWETVSLLSKLDPLTSLTSNFSNFHLGHLLSKCFFQGDAWGAESDIGSGEGC